MNARIAMLGQDLTALTATARSLVRQFALYFVVSAGALALDFGLFLILNRAAGVHYLAASAISFSTGAIVAYLLSITLVFDERRFADRRIEFASFFMIGVVGLGVNQLTLWGAVAGLGLSAPVGKVAAAGLSFIANFIARRSLLFTAPAPK